MEKWVVRNRRADFYGLAEKFHLDPLIIRLMVNRGMETEEQIETFLHGGEANLHDPRKMKDIEKAAEKILTVIREGKPVVIASDFDVDGVFSGWILHEGLKRLGAEVSIKTPHRIREGYGVNRRIVDEALQEQAGLMITCDNGIAAFDALEYAAANRLPVIVTDHHEVAYTDEEDGSRTYRLPTAYAIVNPKQPDCTYPFPGLCGAGVAFKLIQHLYDRCELAKEELVPLIDYAAIATVADVMELVDENRILVKMGLKHLPYTKNVGLRALIDACKLRTEKMTSYHIGFIIGPCINAAGRLESAGEAFALLQAKAGEEAERRALHLAELNARRKSMTVEGTRRAMEQIESSPLKNDRVLVVVLNDCHESLVGIIAGKLKEHYYRPVIVLTEVEDGYKGSGRSIETYHMFEQLQKCRDLFTRFGGHAMAAGLSLPKENLEELRRRLNEDCGLTEEDLTNIIRIDAAMPLEYINEDLIHQMEVLEPVGTGNPQPLFAESRFRIRRLSIIGKAKNTLKMKINNASGTIMEALYFGDVQAFEQEARNICGDAEWECAQSGTQNRLLASFTYYPSVNEYMGRKTLQVMIQNYRFLKE